MRRLGGSRSDPESGCRWYPSQRGHRARIPREVRAPAAAPGTQPQVRGPQMSTDRPGRKDRRNLAGVAIGGIGSGLSGAGCYEDKTAKWEGRADQNGRQALTPRRTGRRLQGDADPPLAPREGRGAGLQAPAGPLAADSGLTSIPRRPAHATAGALASMKTGHYSKGRRDPDRARAGP